jgi:hypothetical protein
MMVESYQISTYLGSEMLGLKVNCMYEVSKVYSLVI